ncbi:uncharacterized protein RJT20DRAFT_127302 [Scheffersomyces xylosifermentans]|uniref:uncharacterized protein n=1 Tax=Scheffersomyces xylosifermentans TaxID=1304137 RepID=UPI00315D97EA
MASVIVVDSELSDSLKEYAHIIDAANQNTELSSALQPLVTGQDISDKQAVIAQLYKHSGAETLRKLTDKEFEPSVYLLIHILTQLSPSTLDDASSPLFKIILETNPSEQPTIRDRKSIKSTTVLSILNTIFNLLPETSKTRTYILSQILHVVKVSNLDFSLIEKSIGLRLITWLKQSGSSDEEIRSTFWKFITLDSRFSAKSLNLIKSFTATYPLNASELAQLITFSLSSDVVDVSFLVNNNVSNALGANSQDKLVGIFTKFVQGELVQVTESEAEGLPFEKINAKSRILSLAKFFSEQSSSAEHDSIIFKYNEIPNVSSTEDFETLLVDAIKSGVIEGKLNQVEETFYLTRVNRFVLAGNDQQNAKNWADVRTALLEWRNSLTNINEIVKSSRENIVNSSN